jgi:hypothetical protein
MLDRFPIGIPAQGIVGSLPQLRHRSSGIPSALKVHRQLRRDVTRMGTITGLQAFADAAVYVNTLRRWHLQVLRTESVEPLRDHLPQALGHAGASSR